MPRADPVRTAPPQPGHVATVDMPVSHIKEQLSQIKGHIVTCPLNFLREGKAPPGIALLMRHDEVDAEILARLGHHLAHPGTSTEHLFEVSAEVNRVTLAIYL